VPTDDGAAAVHGRRGGALAEAGDGPRGEGAGRSWRSAGHSWRRAGWLEGRRQSGRTAARLVGNFGSLTASFHFTPRLRKF
jgi:hypothetical protein